MPAREQRETETTREDRASDAGKAPALQIGRLYEQHERMIGALCRVLLRDPVEAEDAVQQTFLAAFGSLIAGTEPRRPAAWLATIARRECWARTAQRRRRPLPLGEVGEPSADGDPLEDAVRRADFAAVWNAINDLPRTQREAFLMREFSGLSYAEVAVALGVTESAIESLLVRARRHLRDGLATTVATTNAVLFPVLVLQQRLLRAFSGNNTGARTGVGSAVGVPVAVKITATTAVIVVVGSVGAGVRTTLFSGDRAASPLRNPPRKSSSAVLPDRAVGERRAVGPHQVRAPRPSPLIFRTNGPTSPAADSSRSQHASVGAATSNRISLSADPPREHATGGTSHDPREATSSGSSPTGATSTETPQVAAVPASSPASDGAQTDGVTSSTTQIDTTQTDTTQTDTPQIDTTQTDTPQTDTTQTDTTQTDTTQTDTTQTDTTQTDS